MIDEIIPKSAPPHKFLNYRSKPKLQNVISLTAELPVTCYKVNGILILIFFFFFCFLWSHTQHMEVSRLGVELELQLLAYATATAMPDASRVCDLCHSSRQHWTLNPLSEAHDRTRNLMVPSWIRSHCATMGTP